MTTRSNVSVRSRSNWNLEVLVFKERGKPEYPEKNLSEQGREPTTNSTHIWRRRQDSNPGPHWWEACALTTALLLLAKKLKLMCFFFQSYQGEPLFKKDTAVHHIQM